VLKWLTKKLRGKTSAAIGLPNIYSRLDSAERRVGVLEGAPDPLDQLAEYLFLLETRLRSHQETTLMSLRSDFDSRINDVQKEILRFIELRSVDLQANSEARINDVQNEISCFIGQRSEELQRNLESGLAQLRRSIADLRGLASAGNTSAATQLANTPTSPIDAALYQAFEDRYRGSEELIRERQLSYLDLVSDSLKLGPVLDIGCGRGEWLKILNDREFESYGIDTNPVSVARCRDLGLRVSEDDARGHLSKLDDESLGVISLFQVIEHFPLGEIPLLLGEALRVLKPGGMLVAEFPNIQSVRVGANTFWLDPTHLRPLHPLFVEFVAIELGFTAVELHYPLYESAGAIETEMGRAELAPDVALLARK
jgi:SAM-dependent methyltransferase